MKTILIASMLFLSFTSKATGTPPDAVTAAFKQMFPTVTDVKWGKEDGTEWEGEFTLNGNEMSANFSEDGKWIETETEIEISALPTAVVDGINATYPGAKITEANVVKNANGGFYEVDLSGAIVHEAAFNVDGSPVK